MLTSIGLKRNYTLGLQHVNKQESRLIITVLVMSEHGVIFIKLRINKN